MIENKLLQVLLLFIHFYLFICWLLFFRGGGVVQFIWEHVLVDGCYRQTIDHISRVDQSDCSMHVYSW